MENVRIGRDITFVWQVRRDGSALTTADESSLTIEIVGRNGDTLNLPFIVSNENIVATWYGIRQSELGDYSLVAWYDKGRVGQSVVDRIWAVTLVDSTADDSLEQTITINLEGGNLQFGAIVGDSAYEVAVANGFVGTEAEWLESLKEPAETAAALANAAATTANSAAQTATNAATTATNAAETANNAANTANTAATNADTAKTNAETATTNAITATESAVQATEDANTATTNANNATSAAETATTNANNAATNADNAATSANDAATAANQAVSATNTAIANAVTATNNANTATASANVAAQNASDAADSATDAAQAANQAVVEVEGVIGNAETATLNANTAATNAQNAATSASNAATLADNAATNANTKATLADEKATLANTKAEYADEQGDYAKEQGDYAKAQGDALQSALDAKEDISNKTTALSSSSTDTQYPSAKAVNDALSNKANIDGYYESLTAGLALNLIDTKGTGTEQEFTFRTSCGSESIADDGSAIVQKFMGRSLAWNQLVENGDFSEGTSGWNAGNSTITAGDGYITQTATGASSRYIYQSPSKTIPSGHKVLVSVTLQRGQDTSAITAFYLRTVSNTFDTYISSSYSSTEKHTRSAIIETTDEINLIMVYGALHGAVGDIVDYYDIVAYDLTLMFGAGKEPTTVAEFESLYPPITYAHNGGVLINNKATGITTNGFNQWDEEWEIGGIDPDTGANSTASSIIRSTNYISVFPNTTYYFKNPVFANGNNFGMRYYDANKNYIGYYDGNNTIIANGNRTFLVPSNAYYIRFFAPSIYGTTYNNDICINLSWSGYRNGEYEPYWTETREKDLTAITGKLNGEGDSVTIFPDGMKSAGDAYDEIYLIDGQARVAVKRIGEVDMGDLGWQLHNSGNSLFVVSLDDRLYALTVGIMNTKYELQGKVTGYGDVQDKKLAYYYATTITSKNIYIKDTTYPDAATFKTAMSGVKLYYELATPLTYILDEGFNTTYRVADFGTEKANPIGVDANGVPLSAPFRAVIKYSDDMTRTIANLPKNYISTDSMENLLTALQTAGVITSFTATYNSTTHEYDYTISTT